MADDKNNTEGKGEGKKGLPPILLVAIGAMLGGAGVVFAVPPKVVEKHDNDTAQPIIPIQHPDLMQFQFNPRTKAGKAFGSFDFYFVYEVRKDLEEAAFEAIRSHWDRARSSVLMLLSNRTMDELNGPGGKEVLTHAILDELDAVIFPSVDGHKLATVSEILWSKWMIQ